MSGTALGTLRRAVPTISVGMLTADLSRLGEEMELLASTGTEVVHFDVMDGVFCPMTTIGPPIVEAVRTSMLKDVHLMVDEPLDKLDAYVAAGADIVTVHAESTRHLHRTLQRLGELENANDPARGIVRGVALNPGTPLEAVDAVWEECDLLVLLAVNPGWGGQSFLESTARKVEAARERGEALAAPRLVCIDGGVKKNNIADIAALGVDLIVTGSAVFDGRDPEGNARFMLDAVSAAAPA